MKTLSSTLYVSIIAIGLFSLAGCNGGNSGCNNCQTITTHVTINGQFQLDQNVPVNGTLNVPSFEEQTDCDSNSTGAGSFQGTTDQNGSFTANNIAIGHACAWTIFRGTSAKCPVGNSFNAFFTMSGGSHPIDCGVQINTFTASPNKIDPTMPPSTITITGQNMSGTFGMPQILFYDSNQNVLLQLTATSVTSDGTTLVLPGTGVTFADGFYAAVVYTLQSNGSWQPVGGVGIETETPPPPPPPPCRPPMPCC